MLEVVQAPFIIVTIGNNTFGNYSDVDFPNFMTSLSVVKVNGTVNQYTLKMTYQVAAGDDPNLLEQIFSNISANRMISIQYGDYTNGVIYKEEKAVITKITTAFDIGRSKIEYTISCTGNGLSLNSTKYNFPAKVAKGSDVIKELLQTPKYGIKDVFGGMSDVNKVFTDGLIQSDDKKVQLQPKNNCTVLEYIKYVTSSMQNESDTKDTYQVVFYDEEKSQGEGTFFKISKISSNNTKNQSKNNKSKTSIKSSLSGASSLTVDVGYPSDDNIVTSIQIQNDETWSFLYNYDEKVSQSQKRYAINSSGQVVTSDSSSLEINSNQMQATAAYENWLSNVTNYPIQVQITLTGLSKASMLMDSVDLYVLFYGKEHIATGHYVVTKQVDDITDSGFRTTLSLLRNGPITD